MNWVLMALFQGFGLLKGIVNGIFQVKHDRIVLAGQTLLQFFLKLRQNGLYDQLTLTTGAQIILAEMQSEHWLLACWRPLIAVIYCVTGLGMLVLAYFGIFPPLMNDTMLAYFTATNTFVMGYGLLRTREKNKRLELINQIANNIANGQTNPMAATESLLNNDEDSESFESSGPKYGPGSPTFDKENSNLKKKRGK